MINSLFEQSKLLIPDLPWKVERLYKLACFGLFIFVNVFSFCFSSSRVWGESLPPPDDIRLLSVFAADSEHVWAVGEMGVVKATSDGGATWEIQFLPKTTQLIPPTLTDVFFLDKKRGWIVGKQYGYGRQGTFGVIYQTHDGGKSWFALDVRFPNPLSCVRFLDGTRGLAAGQPSETNPSGIFLTSDSGKSWVPMGLTADSMAQTWQAVAFSKQQGFALASRSGGLATLRSLETAVQAKGLFHGNYLTALTAIDDSQNLFGVGRAGMVLKSPDFGVSWNWAELPQGASEFDFRAAAAAGDQFFTAGAPGNRIFVGNIKNQTWTVVPLPDSVPINDLSFADSNFGWAVGDLGRILATSDGGTTWTVQQSGGKRSAILAIFPSIEQAPWELLASLSVQQRGIVVLEVVGSRPELFDPCRPSEEELIQAAGLRCGITETRLWTGFPISETASASASIESLFSPKSVKSAGKGKTAASETANSDAQNAFRLNQTRINELWNAENDGRAGTLLRQKLVKELRVWKPELVLVQYPDPRAESGVEKILLEAVEDSIKLAADPLAFSEQITDSGLAAWKTSEILAVTSPELDADWQLSTNQAVTLLQGTLRSAGQESRRMIDPVSTASGYDKIRLKRLTSGNGSGGANGLNAPLAGLRPGKTGTQAAQKLAALTGSIRLIPHENQREYRDYWSQDESRLESQIRLTNNTLAMINHPTGIFQNNPAALVSYIGRLVNDLTENQAVGVLDDLSSQFRTAGELALAAEIDYLLFSRYNTQPGADQAAIRLIQYYCSAEIQASEKSQAPFIPPDTAFQQAQSRLQLASLFCAQLRMAKPNIYEQGETRRIIAALERRSGAVLGGVPENETRSESVASQDRNWAASAVNSAFYDAQTILAAKAELWLSRQTGTPVLPTIHAVRTDQAPHLDGILDDSVWGRAKPILLTGAPSAYRLPTTVRVAWDGQYLYLGAQIPKQPGFIYAENKRPRCWDEEISESDQINLILDTDRDYKIAFRLACDYNGRPNDSCGDNRNWNPRWFIAAKINSADWTLEWAVPWSELLVKQPESGEVLAVQLFRLISGWGAQSIPRLDNNLSTEENQSWGLLLLEP